MLVPRMLYGNPIYLASLDELINSTEHCEAAVVENGTRGIELSRNWRSEDDCADNLRNRCENKHSGNLLKCILANNEQQTVMLRNYVIWKVQRVRFVKSQNNKFVTLYHQSVRNSVTARVRDSGSHNSSQTPIAFARHVDSVRNSERPQYRGVRKVTVRRVDCILIYLK